jgi:hypothetical protein
MEFYLVLIAGIWRCDLEFEAVSIVFPTGLREVVKVHVLNLDDASGG